MSELSISARRLPADTWRAVGTGYRIARIAAFWVAVALPFAYLPLALLAPTRTVEPTVIVGAVGLNLLALVVGHRHQPRSGRLARR